MNSASGTPRLGAEDGARAALPGEAHRDADGDGAAPAPLTPADLRVPTEADALTWWRVFNDPEVMEFHGGSPAEPAEYEELTAAQRRHHAERGFCFYTLLEPAGSTAGPTGSRAARDAGGDGMHPSGEPASAYPEGVRLSAAGGTAGTGETVRTAAGTATGAAGRPVMGFTGAQPWPYDWGPVGEVEIGWRLGRAYWGRGYATAAARLALEAVRAAGVPHVVAMVAAANSRSIAVTRRLGMRHAETLVAPVSKRDALCFRLDL